MLITTLMLASAQASTFAEVPSLETLTDRAAAVVKGEVIGSRTDSCSIGLCTTHTVPVQQVLKGTAAETVEVVLPGGTLNGLTQRAAGFPRWKEGSQVILFVSTDGTVPANGLMTVTDGAPVDPLHRTRIPTSVEDLATFVRKRESPVDID